MKNFISVQSKKEYTLKSFREMAEKFKGERFPPLVSPENEFWRLVSSNEDVSVEYGDDLGGSGEMIKLKLKKGYRSSF